MKSVLWQEYSDVNKVLSLKEKTGESVSVVIPTLNEEKTIGATLSLIKEKLMGTISVVDELIVLDGGSTDKTEEICNSFAVSCLDARIGKGGDEWSNGKGLALWRAQFVTKGDIILFVDADIENFDERFILGQAGALLDNRQCGFVKGYYKRPIKLKNGEKQATGGGRVTELLIRPLFSRFYPEAAQLSQPLSGEYGFRREQMSHLTFYTGYGVETALVLDYIKKYGSDTVIQVDLGERIHRNRPLSDLGKMASVILQTFIDFAEEDNIIREGAKGGDIYYALRGDIIDELIIDQEKLPPACEVLKWIC